MITKQRPITLKATRQQLRDLMLAVQAQEDRMIYASIEQEGNSRIYDDRQLGMLNLLNQLEREL